ncbi:DUF2922 domain-containing protein [Desulfosporosinus orientis]|uniref:DUF2922 domain-containing protein n=1 Tax=Desulfosporosinus orientis TaxID=1563 RepID=UPI0002E7B5B7|nr:DUF2922 domain-containing protein [Desulfosporosinus orientis]
MAMPKPNWPARSIGFRHFYNNPPTIPDPKENLVKADAETVMDMIIEKNVFITSSGELTKKRDIRVSG